MKTASHPIRIARNPALAIRLPQASAVRPIAAVRIRAVRLPRPSQTRHDCQKLAANLRRLAFHRDFNGLSPGDGQNPPHLLTSSYREYSNAWPKRGVLATAP